MQKLMQHQEEPPPLGAGVAAGRADELNAVLLRMMAKRPEERFQIPLLAAAALRRSARGPPSA